MKILVINCGSSSFKYQLLSMETETALCSGLVERIGDALGTLTHKTYPGTSGEKKFVFEQNFSDHTVGMRAVMELLVDPEKGVIKNVNEINAVGHRVVQGGETLQHSCIVGPSERASILKMASLAPLHNPANLQGIDVAQKLLPHAPSVAVFDTEFHATMPPKAFLYAVPYQFYTELGIRRYGFHGTSHRYVAETAARFLNKEYDSFNAITCHLGNGCSLAAIKNGQCVDTSMGMTPLAGVIMGTRSGDIDPAIHLFINEHKQLSIQEIDSLLNKQSGLKGICGVNDMRDIHAAREKGDKQAQLAFEMFCYSIRKYLGAYYAVLGRLDALIFTAGIGENDSYVREEVCCGLENLGIEILAERNQIRSSEVRIISPERKKPAVMVVPTNEELAIAKATKKIVEK